MDDLIPRLQERILDPQRAVDFTIREGQTVPPPVSTDQLGRVEGLLGFELPPLLRSLYLQVGNGGFGPGYGLFDLPLGEPGCADLVGMYWYVCQDERQPNPDKGFNPETAEPLVVLPEDQEWADEDNAPDIVWDWPTDLLPIFSHGCGAYECVDLTQPGAPMVLHDPDFFAPDGPMKDTFAELAPSLERRLEAWLAGEDLQQRARSELERRAGFSS
jgi:hypothetical protein